MLDLFKENKSLVMGILNVTPDSFYDGQTSFNTDKALAKGMTMVCDGADIIDVGGESTRPGYTPVSVDEELSRVIPVIEKLKFVTDKPISIDTTKYEVAKEAVAKGASIINDVSCIADSRLAQLAAENDCYYVLMHNRTASGNSENPFGYNDFAADYVDDMMQGIIKVRAAGVKDEKIILDPGVGFAKDQTQNLYVINHVDFLKKTGYPVLLGASRKSIIGDVLGLDKDKRLEGTLAVAAYGILHGVDIVRVHDVKEHVRAVRMLDVIRLNG